MHPTVRCRGVAVLVRRAQCVPEKTRSMAETITASEPGGVSVAGSPKRLSVKIRDASSSTVTA